MTTMQWMQFKPVLVYMKSQLAEWRYKEFVLPTDTSVNAEYQYMLHVTWQQYPLLHVQTLLIPLAASVQLHLALGAEGSWCIALPCFPCWCCVVAQGYGHPCCTIFCFHTSSLHLCVVFWWFYHLGLYWEQLAGLRNGDGVCGESWFCRQAEEPAELHLTQEQQVIGARDTDEMLLGDTRGKVFREIWRQVLGGVLTGQALGKIHRGEVLVKTHRWEPFGADT